MDKPVGGMAGIIFRSSGRSLRGPCSVGSMRDITDTKLVIFHLRIRLASFLAEIFEIRLESIFNIAMVTTNAQLILTTDEV